MHAGIGRTHRHGVDNRVRRLDHALHGGGVVAGIHILHAVGEQDNHIHHTEISRGLGHFGLTGQQALPDGGEIEGGEAVNRRFGCCQLRLTGGRAHFGQRVGCHCARAETDHRDAVAHQRLVDEETGSVLGCAHLVVIAHATGVVDDDGPVGDFALGKEDGAGLGVTPEACPLDGQIVLAAAAVDAALRAHVEPELIAHRHTVEDRRRLAVDGHRKVTGDGILQRGSAGQAGQRVDGFHHHQDHVGVVGVARFGHVARLRFHDIQGAEVTGQREALRVVVGQRRSAHPNRPVACGQTGGVVHRHLFHVVEIVHAAHRRQDVCGTHNRVRHATGQVVGLGQGRHHPRSPEDAVGVHHFEIEVVHQLRRGDGQGRVARFIVPGQGEFHIGAARGHGEGVLFHHVRRGNRALDEVATAHTRHRRRCVHRAVARGPIRPGVEDDGLAGVGVVPAVLDEAGRCRILDQVTRRLDQDGLERGRQGAPAKSFVILFSHQRHDARHRRRRHAGAAARAVARRIVVGGLLAAKRHHIGLQATVPRGAAAAARAQGKVGTGIERTDHDLVLGRRKDGVVAARAGGGIGVAAGECAGGAPLRACPLIGGGPHHRVRRDGVAAAGQLTAHKLIHVLRRVVVETAGHHVGVVAHLNAQVVDGIVHGAGVPAAVGGQPHRRGHAAHLEVGATAEGAVRHRLQTASAHDTGHMRTVSVGVVLCAQQPTGKIGMAEGGRVDAGVEDGHVDAGAVQPVVVDGTGGDGGALHRVYVEFGAGDVVEDTQRRGTFFDPLHGVFGGQVEDLRLVQHNRPGVVGVDFYGGRRILGEDSFCRLGGHVLEEEHQQFDAVTADFGPLLEDACDDLGIDFVRGLEETGPAHQRHHRGVLRVNRLVHCGGVSRAVEEVEQRDACIGQGLFLFGRRQVIKLNQRVQ